MDLSSMVDRMKMFTDVDQRLSAFPMEETENSRNRFLPRSDGKEPTMKK